MRMDVLSIQTDMARRLLRAGMLLFLLGLMSALALPLYTETTLEFTTYFELVMSGVFLVGVGLLWPNLKLNRSVLNIVFWVALVGAFGNWVGTVLGTAWSLETTIPYTAREAQTALGAIALDPTALEPSIRLKVLLWMLPMAAIVVSAFTLWGLEKLPSPTKPNKAVEKKRTSHFANEIR